MSTQGSDESLSVLVPAYNEAATIVTALERLWAVDLPIPCEVIVVDDASSDDTCRLVDGIKDRSPYPLSLLSHERNSGKTAALRTGLERAAGSLTLVYDADLEYDPVDIPLLLAPVLDGRADAVYGSRFLSPERRVLFFWHALGNRLITAFANMFANLNLTDMETCFKLVRTDILRSMRLRSERFGFEPEVTVKLGRLGLRVYEVPIRYSGRSYDEGKKIGFRDAVRAVGTCIRAGIFELPAGTPDARTRYALGRLGSYYAELIRRVAWAVGDTVLEFAPGAGEVSAQIIQKSRVVLAEPDGETASRLRTRFSHRPNVEVRSWNPPDRANAPPSGSFDAVLAFHGAGKPHAASNTLNALADCLKPDGRIVVLLPASPSLYGRIDRNMGLQGRFTKDSAKELVEEAGLSIEWMRPINAVGAVGWWLVSNFLRSSYIRPSHIRFFRLAMPLFKLERWIRSPFGLSYLIVARPR